MTSIGPFRVDAPAASADVAHSDISADANAAAKRDGSGGGQGLRRRRINTRTWQIGTHRFVKTPRLLPGLLLLAFVVSDAPAGGAGAVELLPHRAIYRMKLTEAKRASGVVAARGTMVYEFGMQCDGWTVENRTRLRLTHDSGRSSDSDWTFVSWESLDGLAFRFRARFIEDGQMVERITGEAELTARGSGGVATLSEPAGVEIRLPEGTIFPTEHVALMIAFAKRGKTSLTRTVFDGASLENPYLVSATFGPLGVDDAEALAAATGLPPSDAWWTRMAFFPERDRSVTPEFELGARYRVDGVADRITQQFDDFTLEVRLKAFEALPRPDC